ncbi:IS630 family transposase [Nocardia sp. CA-107356]|uniref:IS630 family transposase n=1 Tax=Nocardia sp. CA-107356 TaxID=3239972 RepID=UPI003D8EC292
MPIGSPYVVCLTSEQRSELEAVTRRATAPQRQVLRARIVLAAADGVSNAGIATVLGVCVDTVRKWRNRFCRNGIKGLVDLPRSGRPRAFAAGVVAEVKALACELPAWSGLRLARWSCPELAREVVARGVTEQISASTVRRWLADDAIKPWQHRSWIFPRDPYFAVKAGRVLDLDARVFDGLPLGADEFVLSVDEKPGVQARARKHPSLPPEPRRAVRIESEYARHGTLAYFAAYDVHRAHVIGRCEATTGIQPFGRLVDQVMTTEPYASAQRVFWIVDNGASHRNWAAAHRLNDAYPNAHMIHLPVHASWLNQVEIYFSAVQRKALTPDNFPDLHHVAERLLAFQNHYNATAHPFDWTFTRADLNNLLHRLGHHNLHTPRPEPAWQPPTN